MYLGKWGLYLQLVAEILIFPFTTQIHVYDVFPASSVLINPGSYIKYPRPSQRTQKQRESGFRHTEIRMSEAMCTTEHC